MDYCGNNSEEGIIVAIRMRPLNSKELSSKHGVVWKCLPEYNSITQCSLAGDPLPESTTTFFSFDQVYGTDSNTMEVYDGSTKNIVTSVVKGLNATIFAYGQTSSGKTFTMAGANNGQTPGIIHLALDDIFRMISTSTDRDFLLRVSFLEIYNENLRDLLNPQGTVRIKEDPKKGVFIETTEKIITDFNQIFDCLNNGQKHRVTATTDMNARSSRSHSIFRLVVESKERSVCNGEEDADGGVLVGSLNLVDLAGSESVRHTGATGDRQKEGGKINQSLLALSNVIFALGLNDKGHINFRDSKLTRVLEPSLSGDARMAVVCCCTGAGAYLEETRSTLMFAARAKLVKTKATVNEVLDDRAQIVKLKRELRRLQEEMATGGCSGGIQEIGGSVVDLAVVSQLEQEKKELEEARQRQSEKIERLTQLIVKGGVVGLGPDEERVWQRQTQKKKRVRDTWCPGDFAGKSPALGLFDQLMEEEQQLPSLKLARGLRGSHRMNRISEASCDSLSPRKSFETPFFSRASDGIMDCSTEIAVTKEKFDQLLAQVNSSQQILKAALGVDDDNIEDEHAPFDLTHLVSEVANVLRNSASLPSVTSSNESVEVTQEPLKKVIEDLKKELSEQQFACLIANETLEEERRNLASLKEENLCL